jgi:hypothetical protein
MGLYPGYPQWYVCTVPGFYEISADLTWAPTSAQADYTAQGWIAVAQGAAQALNAGTATPLTVNQYVCPVGSAVRMNSAGITPINAVTERIYLGLGDMVALCGEQNYTAARSSSAGLIGSHMSIRFAGLATSDDRVQVNSSIANGGTVTTNPKVVPGQYVYLNAHTYSYEGSAGGTPFGRRNTDLGCYQGYRTGSAEGSQTAQIVFNSTLISSQLTGHTVTSATLTCQNLNTFYSTGSSLMLGYTTLTPGATTFNPRTTASFYDVYEQKFRPGQKLTFSIPASFVQKFVSGGGTAFILGDAKTTYLSDYGEWQGGPGKWTLTVNYK